MSEDKRKRSYTIPCASRFRDRVLALADARRVNVGDLARSVLLVVPADIIEDFDDPGEPNHTDRETVILKSGRAMGRPWRRKPRLQVRMSPGFSVIFMRKALGIALALAEGETTVKLAGANDDQPPAPVVEEPQNSADEEELIRLRTIISVLSFEPLEGGVHSRDDALFVLGLPPGSVPDRTVLRARFRVMATIHHPDSETGDHRRMSQLNTAMEILRRYA